MNGHLPPDAKELPQPKGIETKEVGARMIAPGEVVMEIGGSTRMTVSDIAVDGVVCQWFEGDALKQGKFPFGGLRLAPVLYERNPHSLGDGDRDYHKLGFLGTPERLRIARVIYEANRAYCATMDDLSFAPWEHAQPWQVETILKGIDAVTSGEVSGPQASHESWLAEKRRTGWTYGPVKDAEAKTHPCMVPYDQLPAAQRRKDHLFLAIVHALTKDIG